MTRQITFVCNPASGGADEVSRDDLIAPLRHLGTVDVFEAPGPETFDEELRAATRGSDLVVVGAGDGTVNLTINALAERLDDVTLGVLPLGTGNDLCRTLGVPLDPVEGAEAIARGVETVLDVGLASGRAAERLFINGCMGGFPVQVDESISEQVKERLGAFAFWYGGAKAALDLRKATVTIQGRTVPHTIAVGVGNGRSVGGGIEVWPQADPGDGVLDVCALAADSLLASVRLALDVKSGEHVDNRGVVTDKAVSFKIEAEPAIEINVDGELIGLRTPATFEIVRKVRILAPHK